MFVSAISLVCSVALMILFAARRGDGLHMAYAHMCIAAITAIGFAGSFIKANNELRGRGASKSAVAANTSRFVGYVWAWGAIALLTVYATRIEVWREWPTFTTACVILAALSLSFGAMLQKDADKGKDDPALLKLGHWSAIVLLSAMVVTIVGLVVDGKMVRFFNPRYTDWVANNIFFFGAIALAAITGYALKFKQD